MDCGGVCRDLATDRFNCGGCGTTCANGEVCSGVACTVTCGGSLQNCAGICRDLSTDRFNCGGCGTTCANGEICAAGTCQTSCPNGQIVCGGTCVNATTLICGAAIDLGTLSAGSSTQSAVRKLPGVGQEDWFLVRFPQLPNFNLHGTGAPAFLFAVNDATSFRFDVYANCGGSGLPCGSGTPIGLTSYGFSDSCVAPGCVTRTTAWPIEAYVRVRRVSGAACGNYQLRVTR